MHVVSDDERLAVARRLRMSRSEWSGMCWKLWLGPKFGAVVLSDGNRDELEDAAHLLADLIEPTCDRDALLDMEDEMFESATGLALISELEEDAELKDLQTTMAKVLFGYARRIREACGEVDG